MGGKEAKEGGRSRKESHEGRETDTKHGSSREVGGGWAKKQRRGGRERRKGEEGEEWRVMWGGE